jgi:hypothetical protein
MISRCFLALFLVATFTLLVSPAAAQASGSRSGSDIIPIGPFPRIPA